MEGVLTGSTRYGKQLVNTLLPSPPPPPTPCITVALEHIKLQAVICKVPQLKISYLCQFLGHPGLQPRAMLLSMLDGLVSPTWMVIAAFAFLNKGWWQVKFTVYFS